MFAHFGGPVFMARMFELADRTCSILLWTSGPENGPIMGVIRDVDHLADLMGRHVLDPMIYLTRGC